MSILISVIIPNYNHCKYLRKRIDSVLNQTYKGIEVIILDDNSTDASKNVIEGYKDFTKVSYVVFNEKNSGSTFKQWEKGIQLAKGEWIWIAESDDWCEPTFLEELVKNVQASPGVTISFCQSIAIDDQNQILYTTHAKELIEVVDGHEFIKKCMFGGNRIINASMAIFKKSCYYKIPNDYLSMTYCGDWFFWINICLQGQVAICGKYLNYYLRHNANVATSAEKKGLQFTEGNKIYKFILENLSVSAQDKEDALKIKIDEYISVKDSLLNEDVRSEVLQSMIAVDPSVKKIIDKASKKPPNRKLYHKFKRTLKHLIRYD